MSHACAQPYPSRQITFLVPNLPGGSSDLIARAVGARLQSSLGEPVIVDNKPGASELIATEYLARAEPDGYTIAILSNALAINETLSLGRKYEAMRDLVPVAKLAELPLALIVTEGVPSQDVRGFVAYAKEHPGKLSYGHVGVGAPQYLTMEWFKRQAGLDILPVPYRSSAPLYTALLGGDIQVTMGALGGATEFIKAGQVKALASMSNRRPASQPNLPTIAEAGYPEFDLVPWMGVFVPAKTSAKVIQKLEAELLHAGQSPELRQQLEAVGLELSPEGAAEFSGRVKRDIGAWAKVIQEVGVTPQ
ncbi:MAG: tripartite tricarboxylate transporter substrate binding protein [Xanthobacteraceae bacterium]|nr:tripartite tricarboxylate transporter substrate binding protein [Xanthobacteraceae bacterium]